MFYTGWLVINFMVHALLEPAVCMSLLVFYMVFFYIYVSHAHAVPAPLIVDYVIENTTLRINWTVSDEMLNSIIFILLYIKSDQKYRPHIENYNITASADGINESLNEQLQPSVTTYNLSLSNIIVYTVSKITVNVIASNVLGYNKGSETTISKYSITHIHNYSFSDYLTILSYLHNILKSFLRQLPLVRAA